MLQGIKLAIPLPLTKLHELQIVFYGIYNIELNSPCKRKMSRYDRNINLFNINASTTVIILLPWKDVEQKEVYN